MATYVPPTEAFVPTELDLLLYLTWRIIVLSRTGPGYCSSAVGVYFVLRKVFMTAWYCCAAKQVEGSEYSCLL